MKGPNAQVVITRPVGAAGTLPRRLRALGFDPLVLPPLSLAVHDDVDTRAALASLHEARAVVAVSAAAVHFARRLSPHLHLPAAVHALAVGARSARALARICQATPQWPTRRADSEGLLALPVLADVRGWRIGILAAPGGRSLIADTLAGRGARVDVLHVYRRRPARWTQLHRARLAALEPHANVLVTSAEALHTLLVLAGTDAARVLAGRAIVSSRRLVALARRAGFRSVGLAAGPDDEALLRAVVADAS